MDSSNFVSPDLFVWMKEIRENIHRHPELSGEELSTSAFIHGKLSEIGIADIRHLAGTGLVAEVGGGFLPPVLGLRADMDALPVQEETGLDFASIFPGIMHACGHDGHVAMLLGAAAKLTAMDLPGKVRFIFQPAEEKGNGAERMIADGALDGLKAIFCGHIDTHFATGTITVDPGIVCAYADPFKIVVKGSGGHAARPHECRDAIVAAASLIVSLQTLVSREVDPNHAAVLTVGKVRAGETHNVIAGEAVIEGTVRSTHPDARIGVIDGLKRMASGVADTYGVRILLSFPDSLPAVVNDVKAADLAGRAARNTVASKNVISQGPSSLGGEDFAFYQRKIPGCMVRFGARLSDKTGPAHSSSFDFDDMVLSIGSAWYAEVARLFLIENR